MKTIELKKLVETDILHNRGCGIAYLQRNHKIPYDAVPEDSWFLRENLTDKISIDAPWCLIEPEEGNFDWEHPEWEGCFQSWIDAGYKVNLKVRAMDTLGTLYYQGVPQWVFDAGAKYVDDPISLYRREKVLLNDVPPTGNKPVRYPVYWDEIYLKKSANFIAALGERYNNHPAVESVSIAHGGRWGEMHIADWGPMEPWYDAGYSLETYNKCLIRIIDMYLTAFPNKLLSLSICPADFYSDARYNGVSEAIDYAASKGVMLKYDGLGNSFEEGSTPYLCKSVQDIFQKYRYKVKLSFENLVLPQALCEGLDNGISYWQRGGETAGLRILEIDKDKDIYSKRIFSWYAAWKERYDDLPKEMQKDCWRIMARKCGYRLALDKITIHSDLSHGQSFDTTMQWSNSGSAGCLETFEIKLSLFDSDKGKEVWSTKQLPGVGNSQNVWDAGKTITDTLQWQIPQNIQPGNYELRIGLQHKDYNQEMMQLATADRTDDGMYAIDNIQVK